jgi:hypothetical protein
MITLNYSITAQGGTAPLSYVVRPKSGLESACSCLEIVNASGTVPTSGIVNFQVLFENQTCLEYSITEDCELELVITDAENCVETIDVELWNPCENIEASIIRTGETTFQAVVTGGNPNYQYYWEYKEGGVEVVSKGFLATPDFSIGSPVGTHSSNGTLTLVVKDQNGCMITSQMSLEACFPYAISRNNLIRIPCVLPETTYNFPVNAVACQGKTIDWQSWELTSFKDYLGNDVNPSSIGVSFFWQPEIPEPVFPQPASILVVIDYSKMIPGSYSATWRVKDNIGIYSNEADIEFHFAACTVDPNSPKNPVVKDDCGCKSSCEEANELGEIRIPVETCLLSTCGCVPVSGGIGKKGVDEGDNCIDEASIEVVAGPYQDNATAYYDPYTNELVYVLPPEPYEGVDVVVWTAKTASGKSLGLINWNIDLNCWPDPIGEDDQECGNCCETINIDVLANDTPGSPLGFDLSSLTIIDPPSHGSAVVLQNGTINYTAYCNYAGLDSFTYIVKDLGTDKYTEVTTVNLEISCAGIEVESIFCSVSTNPVAEINNTLKASGKYSIQFKAYLSNGFNLDIADELDVEFIDVTDPLSPAIIASATLLVGSDLHTPKAGTDNDWTNLIVPHLENKTLTAGSLNSTNGVEALFDKKAFALANNTSNEFDSSGNFVGSDVAIRIETTLVARDMSVPLNSALVSDYLERVKVLVLEDTTYVDQQANPDGNAATDWVWIAPAGVDSIFTTTALDLHPFVQAYTWFSHLSNPFNNPPGRIETYSLTSAPLTELPTGITVDYINESTFRNQLSELMQNLGYNFYLNLYNYRFLETDFSLLGNNSGMFLAFQEEQDPSLNTITVRYKNVNSPNVNKRVRATLKNFLLY